MKNYFIKISKLLIILIFGFFVFIPNNVFAGTQCGGRDCLNENVCRSPHPDLLSGSCDNDVSSGLCIHEVEKYCVRHLQALLKNNGEYPDGCSGGGYDRDLKCEIDGIYSANTMLAVSKFREKKGLARGFDTDSNVWASLHGTGTGSCTIQSVRVNPSTVEIGSTLNIEVRGSNCDNNSFGITITDSGGRNFRFTRSPRFTNNSFSGTWTVPQNAAEGEATIEAKYDSSSKTARFTIASDTNNGNDNGNGNNQGESLLPPGEPWTLSRIMDEVLNPLANFLIAAGIILAVISIVLSGIMYFKAGSNPESVSKATTWFKNGLIGALIILGVGVIINTIALIVTGEAFDFLPGGGGGGGNQRSGRLGSNCNSDDDCNDPLICVRICQRPDGNRINEPCRVQGNCQQGLSCQNGRCRP